MIEVARATHAGGLPKQSMKLASKTVLLACVLAATAANAWDMPGLVGAISHRTSPLQARGVVGASRYLQSCEAGSPSCSCDWDKFLWQTVSGEYV